MRCHYRYIGPGVPEPRLPLVCSSLLLSTITAARAEIARCIVAHDLEVLHIVAGASLIDVHAARACWLRAGVRDWARSCAARPRLHVVVPRLLRRTPAKLARSLPNPTAYSRAYIPWFQQLHAECAPCLPEPLFVTRDAWPAPHGNHRLRQLGWSHWSARNV